MGVMTVRDIPDDLQAFLKADAAANHRSVNRQVIAALHEYRERKRAAAPARTAEERRALIDRIVESARRNRTHDPRTDDELIGYDEHGLPS